MSAIIGAMKHHVILGCALLVAACDSPSPRFSGLVAKQITIGESVFSVRHTEFEVEAIRTKGGYPHNRRAVMQDFASAIRTTSGCAILPGSLLGDPNVVRADLKCPGADEALRPVRPTRLDCTGYQDPIWDDLVDIECEVTQAW